MKLMTGAVCCRAIRMVVVAFPFLMLNGCSVWMATHQEPHHDLSVLKPGHSRSEVLAELGKPVDTEMRDGHRVDVYSFTQGQDGLFNVGRAVGHGAADVFTFGLWEVVGTPTEMVLQGDKVAFEVTYDADDKVQKTQPLNKKAQSG
ncbi:MAG TPA: hypothetical protein VHS31_10990 [Tepidisphaeraceae bacterium]|jgi:outer membrane protein assembly factor BamE (lipoprotein component of BamABCDE complex)|nr:hypothetical protein [Tepidisphaeraceae bacterium]